MKMHLTMSFNYPEDEMKARLAINADQMHETLRWIEDRIKEANIDDDMPESVILAIEDKVRLSIKRIGEPDV
jgi:hypothetical protein